MEMLEYSEGSFNSDEGLMCGKYQLLAINPQIHPKGTIVLMKSKSNSQGGGTREQVVHPMVVVYREAEVKILPDSTSLPEQSSHPRLQSPVERTQCLHAVGWCPSIRHYNKL